MFHKCSTGPWANTAAAMLPKLEGELPFSYSLAKAADYCHVVYEYLLELTSLNSTWNVLRFTPEIIFESQNGS